MLIPPKVLKIASCCDKDSLRYATAGVRLERDDAGVPYAVATDGRRLTRVTWTEDAGDEYPGDFDQTHQPGFSTLLHMDDCKEAAKLPPRRTIKPILANVVVEEASANGEVTYGATDLDRLRKVKAKSVEGKFPDWRAVTDSPIAVVKHNPKQPAANSVVLEDRDYAEVLINPRLLADLLKQASDIACDTDSYGVTLQVPLGAGKPARLVKQHNGIDYLAVLMPLEK